jgi:hypothetical protein
MLEMEVTHFVRLSVKPLFFAENLKMNTQATEFLFIDTNIIDQKTLLASVAANVKIVKINNQSNALEQITIALKGVKNLDAIHIISHGAAGELQFANSVLNNANLSNYESQLKKIGASLSKEGDILLYGCDVAKGENGKAFIHSLAKATKADVAASDNMTGSKLWGGDWILEKYTGKIETDVVIDSSVQINYENLFAPSSITFTTAGGRTFSTLDGDLGSTDISNIVISFSLSTNGSSFGQTLLNTGSGLGLTGTVYQHETTAYSTNQLNVTSYQRNDSSINYFDISSFKIYSPSSATLTINGYVGNVTSQLMYGELEYSYQLESPAPKTTTFNVVSGWNTVNLSNFTGISTLDVVSNQTAVFYYNDFTIQKTIFVPTFSTITTLENGVEDIATEITFANLTTAGNEADSDGTVTAFVVKAVSTGTLKIGIDLQNATDWDATTNAVIDSTKKAFWKPAANANGSELNAFTVVAKDNSGAESATPVQVKVEVAAVNDVPVFTKGANQIIAENAGAQTVSNFATGISAGATDEVAQILTFNLTTSNNAAFATLPEIAANGDLTYTLANNFYDSVTISAVLKDNGGTANSGVDTSEVQTFTISVAAISNVKTMSLAQISAMSNEEVNRLFNLYNSTALNEVSLERMNVLVAKLTAEQYQTHKVKLGAVYSVEELLLNLANVPVEQLNSLPAALHEDTLNNVLSGANLATLSNARLIALINGLNINYDHIADNKLVEILNAVPAGVISMLSVAKTTAILNTLTSSVGLNANVLNVLKQIVTPYIPESASSTPEPVVELPKTETKPKTEQQKPVSKEVEMQVPSASGVKGDGNGDGIPDIEQKHVISLPTQKDLNETVDAPKVYLSIELPQGQILTKAAVKTVAEMTKEKSITFTNETVNDKGETVITEQTLNEDIAPFGLFEFNFEGVPTTTDSSGNVKGGTTDVKLYLDDNQTVEKYLKQTVSGSWEPIPFAYVYDEKLGKTVVSISLTDGDEFDLDGSINGAISDPGTPIITPKLTAMPLPASVLLQPNNTKVFVGYDRTFKLDSGAAQFFGQGGREVVQLGANASNAIIDQNIEHVRFPDVQSDYSFEQKGNSLQVFKNNAAIAQITIQDDANGSLLTFANGTQSAKLVSGVVALSPYTVTNDDLPHSIFNKTSVFTVQSETIGIDSELINVYGSSGYDVIALAANATKITVDQNIEQVNFADKFADYRFAPAGNSLDVFVGTTQIANVNVQDDSDGTKFTFADGEHFAKFVQPTEQTPLSIQITGVATNL